jgi:hypothetical protein
VDQLVLHTYPPFKASPQYELLKKEKVVKMAGVKFE